MDGDMADNEVDIEVLKKRRDGQVAWLSENHPEVFTECQNCNEQFLMDFAPDYCPCCGVELDKVERVGKEKG